MNEKTDIRRLGTVQKRDQPDDVPAAKAARWPADNFHHFSHGPGGRLRPVDPRLDHGDRAGDLRRRDQSTVSLEWMIPHSELERLQAEVLLPAKH
jgi:hypothetical protein